MWKEFKEFISRGNVIDLAIAVMLGAAFGAIIKSLVDDLLMPLIGILMGGIDFSSLSLKVRDATLDYGNLIQAIINFLVIALTLFLIIHVYNKMQKEEESTPNAPPEPSPEEKLLAEIRDLLKEQTGS